MFEKRKLKFGNKPKHCRQGYLHKSTGEAEHCDLLHLWKNSKDGAHIKEIIHERPWPLHCNGILIGKHNVDWTLVHQDGKLSVVEFKGKATELFKWKHKMFLAEYPEIPYTLVKMKSKSRRR